MEIEKLVRIKFDIKKSIKFLKDKIIDIERKELDFEEEMIEKTIVMKKIEELQRKFDFVEEKIEIYCGITDSEEYRTSEVLDLFNIRF